MSFQGILFYTKFITLLTFTDLLLEDLLAEYISIFVDNGGEGFKRNWCFTVTFVKML